jgi:hypothetical protein
MRKIFWLLLPAVASFAAVADEAGTRLSGDELKTLVTGATVTHVARSTGSTRRWKNDVDGSFMATSNNKKYGNALGQHSTSSPGTWSINDEGKYCVRIDWKREEEKWCAYIVRAADGGYYLNSVEPGREIEFSK